MKNIAKILLLFIVIFTFFVSIPTHVVQGQCQILPKPTFLVLGLPWKVASCGYIGLMWGNSILDVGLMFIRSIEANGFYFLYK